MPDSARCPAWWDGNPGEPGWVCGDAAPNRAGDVFLCDLHYERAVMWAAEIGRTESSIVYYARRADGLIKIGTSRSPAVRFADLEREHGALVLLALHRGAHKEEHGMHRLFRDLRVEGEWFRPGLPLMEFILKARVKLAMRTPAGLPAQLDLLELERAVRRLKRA